MKKNDLTGKRFGSLTVLHPITQGAEVQNRWLCRCDCGRECRAFGNNLVSGHSISCGCRKEKDLSGQKIGSLTVISRSDVRQKRGKRTVPTWECLCDCGETVYKSTDDLTSREYHSCHRCKEKRSAEKARANAGFTDGTQLSKIKVTTHSSSNTSGTRGVYFDRRTGKWRARLKLKGKLMSFGTFDRLEDAVTARKKAEEEYFAPILEEMSEGAKKAPQCGTE